jgi:hypothetical protein
MSLGAHTPWLAVNLTRLEVAGDTETGEVDHTSSVEPLDYSRDAAAGPGVNPSAARESREQTGQRQLSAEERMTRDFSIETSLRRRPIPRMST